MARVGGFFALIVKLLRDIWEPAPMIIMGSITVVAGFLALFFPETVSLDIVYQIIEACFNLRLPI